MSMHINTVSPAPTGAALKLFIYIVSIVKVTSILILSNMPTRVTIMHGDKIDCQAEIEVLHSAGTKRLGKVSYI